MPRNGFVGIFGTGRNVAAVPADQWRERQLVEAHEPHAEEAAGRLAVRSVIIAPAHPGHGSGGPFACFDLVEGSDDSVECQHGRGMARPVVLDRLQEAQFREPALRGGAPSLSMARMACRTDRSSAGVAPTITLAMMAEDA